MNGRNCAFFAVAACFLPAICALGAEPARQPERWAKDIATFEQRDRRRPPTPGSALFVGSSSIRRWDLTESFPDLRIVNRGFGGSQICDSVHYFDVLVARHKPSTVVLYAGDNDIASGKSPQQVHRDFREFAQRLHEAVPDAQFVFIAIKPSIKRWRLADVIRATNRLIAADCEKDDGMEFVDVWPEMLDADGTPRKDLFVADGLHLNAAGYRLWAKLLRPHLARGSISRDADE